MLPWYPPDVWWIVADPEFSLATLTVPVHDIDLGVVERGIMWELTKSLTCGVVGEVPDSHAARCNTLTTVLDYARRHGWPAARARFDVDDEGPCIVIEMVEPIGYG